jgi:UDP-2-acetamido-2,6-beta-L-arabino-hexul-4-ose reductase
MKILVTGSRGFIGRNMALYVKRLDGHQVLEFHRESTDADLTAGLRTADVIVHLAGVNRPTDPDEFRRANVELTRRICDELTALGRRIPLVLASSTQVELENPYGESKRAAEDVVRWHAERVGSPVAICRLPGVFGKWCRPHYNSVVATFCHNTARGLALEVTDPARTLELVYIDDVVKAFMTLLLDWPSGERVVDLSVEPRFRVTLGQLAALVGQCMDSRKTLELPDLSDPFVRRLHATYLSYLPADAFGYALTQYRDDRGTLAELLRGAAFGQMFLSRTVPGVTRGQHYHDTKIEKFIVVEGEAVIRFRNLATDATAAYSVSGREFRVVDIPPGWAHSIQNVGPTELVVLFWASERFDPQVSDTYRAEVPSD